VTKLAIDEALVEEARKLGGHATREEAVKAALEEYIRIRRQLKILDLFGTIDYETDYDYRKHRRREGR
jgi:hypothetical protein